METPGNHVPPQGVLPEVCDLQALIDSLDGDPGHAKLADLARRSRRAQSCHSDLALAATCCESYAQFTNVASSVMPQMHLNAVSHAILASAIILYARATSTSSKGGERGGISIEDRLETLQDLEDHKRIIDLRNRAIAHVHSEEALGTEIWHREKLILKSVGDGTWLPGCVTRRIQANPMAINLVRRMIPIAGRLVRATFLQRLRELAEALEALPETEGMIKAHLFDPISFFDSETSAKEALGVGLGGSAMGLTGG